MTISDRYREITREVQSLCHRPGRGRRRGGRPPDLARRERPWRCSTSCSNAVGDIPRIKLESKLTPVLLKAHQKLDQARLLFEEAGEEDRAAKSWELEQKIYRVAQRPLADR
ncbi:MAG: hypothetical protein MZV49_14910 [Rhodopseudomonas palustris]|nr:hypothetical protein [Rhodopseudomonas palustris]